MQQRISCLSIDLGWVPGIILCLWWIRFFACQAVIVLCKVVIVLRKVKNGPGATEIGPWKSKNGLNTNEIGWWTSKNGPNTSKIRPWTNEIRSRKVKIRSRTNKIRHWTNEIRPWTNKIWHWTREIRSRTAKIQPRTNEIGTPISLIHNLRPNICFDFSVTQFVVNTKFNRYGSSRGNPAKHEVCINLGCQVFWIDRLVSQ